jgi:hypothetical protein
MKNVKGRTARPVGPYSIAVGRVVVALLAERGRKRVDMLRDPRFTSNVYQMLAGLSIITVDDLKAMADFLGVPASEIVDRAVRILPSVLEEASADGDEPVIAIAAHPYEGKVSDGYDQPDGPEWGA